MKKDDVINEMCKTRKKLWDEQMASPCRFKTKVKIGKISKRAAKEAMKHFERLREMVAQRPSPFQGMSEEKVIKKLRQTRQKLWEKKIGVSA